MAFLGRLFAFVEISMIQRYWEGILYARERAVFGGGGYCCRPMATVYDRCEHGRAFVGRRGHVLLDFFRNTQPDDIHDRERHGIV
jgi:hypothetical protein